MRILYVIPARSGSKGIPGKNIKLLAGKPLICYSIDIARELTIDDNICVTTDDDSIIQVVKNYGLEVPFKRPEKLATDFANSYEVILHTLDYYEKIKKSYDLIILLQPTSPFRKSIHIHEALNKFESHLDMIVSVKETKSNPYYNLYEEDTNGFLKKSKNSTFTRRQDCPNVWEINGAIYIINISSLKKYSSFAEFNNIKKYIMDEFSSLDLDVPFDWEIAETIIEKNL